MNEPIKQVERSWYLKYQPKSLDDLKLPDTMSEFFKEVIDGKKDPGNLLFVGLPGSGKTTLSNILIRSLIKSKDDYIQINGSGLTMDVVRPKAGDASKGIVHKFATTPPVKSKYKIVHFEELQRSTPAIQEVYKYLRSLIEATSKNVLYLVTTNSISEIDGPLLQRFQIFTFNVLPKDDIKNYLVSILEKEEIKYKETDIDYVINYYYPSVRAMVQILQQYSLNGVLKLNLEFIDINSKVIQLIQEIISTKNINSKAFGELISILKYQPHLLNINYIIEQLVYSLNPMDMLVVSKYASHITSATNPGLSILSMLGELVTSNHQIN